VAEGRAFQALDKVRVVVAAVEVDFGQGGREAG